MLFWKRLHLCVNYLDVYLQIASFTFQAHVKVEITTNHN